MRSTLSAALLFSTYPTFASAGHETSTPSYTSSLLLFSPPPPSRLTANTLLPADTTSLTSTTEADESQTTALLLFPPSSSFSDPEGSQSSFLLWPSHDDVHATRTLTVTVTKTETKTIIFVSTGTSTATTTITTTTPPFSTDPDPAPPSSLFLLPPPIPSPPPHLPAEPPSDPLPPPPPPPPRLETSWTQPAHFTDITQAFRISKFSTGEENLKLVSEVPDEAWDPAERKKERERERERKRGAPRRYGYEEQRDKRQSDESGVGRTGTGRGRRSEDSMSISIVSPFSEFWIENLSALGLGRPWSWITSLIGRSSAAYSTSSDGRTGGGDPDDPGSAEDPGIDPDDSGSDSDPDDEEPPPPSDSDHPPTLLRITYPAHSINPGNDDHPIGGSQFYTSPLSLRLPPPPATQPDPNTLPQAPRQATAQPKTPPRPLRISLSYFVFFPLHFAWVRGGKLPGLYGGTEGCSGGVDAGGKGCWSTRLMWRAGGVGEVYLYVPRALQPPELCTPPERYNTTCSAEYGLSIGRGAWKWGEGRWTGVRQVVTLNEVGLDEGNGGGEGDDQGNGGGEGDDEEEGSEGGEGKERGEEGRSVDDHGAQSGDDDDVGMRLGSIEMEVDGVKVLDVHEMICFRAPCDRARSTSVRGAAAAAAAAVGGGGGGAAPVSTFLNSGGGGDPSGDGDPGPDPGLLDVDMESVSSRSREKVDGLDDSSNKEQDDGGGGQGDKEGISRGGEGDKGREHDKTIGFKGLFFSTFFGGHEPEYASPREQFVWFKDFEIRILDDEDGDEEGARG